MKKFFKLVMSLSLLGSLMLTTPAFAADIMKVHLNGKDIQFHVDPYVVQIPAGGVTLVELRPLFESMGLQVIWDAKNPNEIIGQKDGLNIVLHFGSKIAKVNSKDVALLTAPQVINNHTLVPLRFISETSGKRVKVVGGNDIQITDIATSGTDTSSNTNNSGSSGTSTSTTGGVTAPTYAYKHLDVYWNGVQMKDSGDAISSFYSVEDGKWYVHFGDFFATLTSIGNVNITRTDNGRIMCTIYNGNTYKFADNDGVYVNTVKIADLKFLDYTAAPVDVYAKALNFTYTVDETGVYITSK